MMNGNGLEAVRRRLGAIEGPLAEALVARLKYSRAPSLYNPNGIKLNEFKGRFLEFFLRGYEPSFFSHPLSHLGNGNGEAEELNFRPVKINRNPEIVEAYLALKNRLCSTSFIIGESATSIAKTDATCLALLSRRVHLGVAVAEAKLESDRNRFLESMSDRDKDKLKVLLRNPEIEESVVQRFRGKALDRGLSPDIAAQFYHEFVIPATVDVQVEYLLNRPLD